MGRMRSRVACAYLWLSILIRIVYIGTLSARQQTEEAKKGLTPSQRDAAAIALLKQPLRGSLVHEQRIGEFRLNPTQRSREM